MTVDIKTVLTNTTLMGAIAAPDARGQLFHGAPDRSRRR